MAIVRKDGNQDQGQRRGDQSALARPDQTQLSRDPLQATMRDPFQALMRDPFQLMREMMTDPFRALQRISLWGDLGREGRELAREVAWNPSFEVRETDDALVFKADLPGVRSEDLEISLNGNILQISGRREREQETDEGTYYAYERSYGQFMRTFSLPETTDLDKIRSELKDGVLTVAVPKKEGTAPRRRKIEISSGSKS